GETGNGVLNAADYDRNFFEKLKSRMPKIIPSYICPRNPYQFTREVLCGGASLKAFPANHRAL
ncbi:hypothetical protein MAF45_10180, partial [Mesosutterella sp. OilRF-GAM-744-9]